MARAGEAVGTVLGTALMAARQGAVTAGKTSAATSRRLAKRTQHQLADHGLDREHLQDVLTENVRRARHELAAKIEPPPRRWLGLPRIGRLRMLFMLAALGAMVAAAMAVMSRRPQVQLEQVPEEDVDQLSASGNGAAPRELETSQTGRSRPAPSPRRANTTRSADS
jgi:hypothetical protein